MKEFLDSIFENNIVMLLLICWRTSQIAYTLVPTMLSLKIWNKRNWQISSILGTIEV